VNCTKTAEQTEMPFGIWTWMVPTKEGYIR